MNKHHQIALKEEDDYLRLRKIENKLNNDKQNVSISLNDINNHTGTNNFNSKEKYNNNRNNYQRTKNNNTDNNSKNNTNSDTISVSTKNPTIKTTDLEKKCRICGNVHNYRECIEKFKFYTNEEAKLFINAGVEPFKRKEPPKERVTAETPFIQRKLEKLALPNSTNTTSTMSSTLTKVENSKKL